MNKKRIELFTCHSFARSPEEFTYYANGRIYTKKEYYQLQKRKQLVKDIVCYTVWIAIMFFRAYVFLEYGV